MQSIASDWYESTKTLDETSKAGELIRRLRTQVRKMYVGFQADPNARIVHGSNDDIAIRTIQKDLMTFVAASAGNRMRGDPKNPVGLGGLKELLRNPNPFPDVDPALTSPYAKPTAGRPDAGDNRIRDENNAARLSKAQYARNAAGLKLEGKNLDKRFLDALLKVVAGEELKTSAGYINFYKELDRFIERQENDQYHTLGMKDFEPVLRALRNAKCKKATTSPGMDGRCGEATRPSGQNRKACLSVNTVQNFEWDD